MPTSSPSLANARHGSTTVQRAQNARPRAVPGEPNGVTKVRSADPYTRPRPSMPGARSTRPDQRSLIRRAESRSAPSARRLRHPTQNPAESPRVVVSVRAPSSTAGSASSVDQAECDDKSTARLLPFGSRTTFGRICYQRYGGRSQGRRPCGGRGGYEESNSAADSDCDHAKR